MLFTLAFPAFRARAWHGVCITICEQPFRQNLPNTGGFYEYMEVVMAIRATGSNYFDAYSLYKDVYKNNKESGSLGVSSGTSSETSAYGGMSGILTPQGRAELKNALDGMKAEGYAKFTFEEIEKYRKEAENTFTATIKKDLAELGVDPDIEFRLVVDSYGSVRVISDHPDKAVIEKYLNDNPEMVKDFKHIQALSNLRRSTQKATAQNPEFAKNLKLSLQAEAIQAFFAATDNNGQDYFSQIANFGADGATSYLLGLNQSV